MEVNCIICSKESSLVKLLQETSIFRCSSCQVEFANPMPTEKQLEMFYRGYKYYTQYDEEMVKKTIIKNADENIKYLEENHGLTRQSRLLDFGCGENLFVKQGDSNNWIGYDYLNGEIPSGKFDFITAWGVLEHLPNPFETMKLLSSKLKKKGKLVMTTVSMETGIPFRYRYPIHLVWWSRRSIEKLFERTGFKTKEISNYFMLQTPEFYLDRVLDRGQVPMDIRKLISINAEDYIKVPTNEIFVVGEKK